MVHDFILELGCEELPSAAVWPLAQELANQIKAALEKAQLNYSEIKSFATPRRLAVLVGNLQAEQTSSTSVRKGPAVVAAYDKEGNPTHALLGFAKSCGVSIEQLRTMETDKGDWIVCDLDHAGRKTRDILPELVEQALSALPIAKPMRWGKGDYEFVRPLHWVVLLYGSEVIDCELLGIKATRCSRGHRFHHPEAISIHSAETYESQLKECFVIANFALRRQMIIDQVQELAQSCDAKAVMPDELIDEVTSIVEWPQALLANFDEAFLEVPAEALIASMQAHQKTFALKNTKGSLLPHFITVANIESTHPQQVIQGNEKVMRARLSDAAFFFNQDKKQPLSCLSAATEKVVFQVQLGSLHDKALRIKALMRYLAPVFKIREQQAERAAELSKCDLLTGMVGEFPELQGLMGYYYALHDKEDPEVALALDEQYKPRFATDQIPVSVLGTVLSLADRMDTLVGIFAIGQKPSGVKDPFKLRRHALAVVRLLIGCSQPLNLSALIAETIKNYEKKITIHPGLCAELKLFILERLNSYYLSQGYSSDSLQAVRARQDDWLYDLDKRVQALKSFTALPQAESLSAACKRVNNLLSHSKIAEHASINEALMEAEAEQILFAEINTMTQAIKPLYAEANYEAVLIQLASLKEPIDNFFDQVMVMVEDEAIKTNRLALLAGLQKLLQDVADISLLSSS